MRIIAGRARGTHIEAPEGRDTRPTLDRVRENLFNMLQGRTPGSRVLDLFAGSGALGLEAVSRGAETAVLVDVSSRENQVQQRNIMKLRFENEVRTLRCSWEEAAARLRDEGAQFDLVFLDPPYAMRDLRKVFEALIPLLAPEGWVILEHEAKADDIAADERFRIVRERSWGYCGITIYERREES